MNKITKPLHELAVVLRLVARVTGKRWRGHLQAQPDRDAFKASCETWLADNPSTHIHSHNLVDVPANQPPWLDTGIELTAGQSVSLFSCGRVYLSRMLDIWVAPRFQLWMRVSEDGEVFSGTRDTHSFVADKSGRLYLASYFPGEWKTRKGELTTDPADYRKASGGITTLILTWQQGTDLPGVLSGALAELAKHPNAPSQVQNEIKRLGNNNQTPSNWKYLWFLGDAEIYQSKQDPKGYKQQSISCHTEADVGILQYDAPMELTPNTLISWEWRIDQLPSDIAEDTLPTHDYLSIAVEFDNGQDITWYWSAELPAETIYTCPLPTWAHRETHIVIRSGEQGLGEWQPEMRNVYDDCIRALGSPAANVTRIWLIANSLFQRQTGDCEYRNIRLSSGEKELLL